MHPELLALIAADDRLHHRAEDVRVDLGPVEGAAVEDHVPGLGGEDRRGAPAGEKFAVHVAKAMEVLRKRVSVVGPGVQDGEQLVEEGVGVLPGFPGQ